MMFGTSRRLVWSFFVAMTLIVVVVATHDLARHHHHRHHHHQQQDQSSSMTSHYYASRQTAGYPCDDVCELAYKSVQRLTATQQDYGRALHTVYGLVDTVRRQVAAVR